jgi:hypothetical protein
MPVRLLLAFAVAFTVQTVHAQPAPGESVLSAVSSKRIFFGHQSVGGNILDGLQEVAKGSGGGGLNIVESSDPKALEKPAIAHALIGKNEEPSSKIAAFQKAMEALGDKADVAFYKFCYVDFDASTDVEKLFGEYQASHDALRSKYPKTTFVHLTTPLTTIQTGPKAWLKRLTGSGAWGEAENVKRHQFNELLRKTYGPGGKNEPVFDLAKAEATHADGRLNTFEREGRQIPYLIPGYTYDSGHLNQEGKVKVARELLTFLAALPAAK